MVQHHMASLIGGGFISKSRRREDSSIPPVGLIGPDAPSLLSILARDLLVDLSDLSLRNLPGSCSEIRNTSHLLDMLKGKPC